MKRTFTLCLLLSLMSLVVGAETLTPEMALNRVKKSQNSPAKTRSRISADNLMLATTIDDQTSKQAACYVFVPENAAKGFMILSADDLAQPVLAYSDDSEFDPNNIPPNMEWFLDCYAREIAAARTAFTPTIPTVAKQPDQIRPNYAPVPPKLTTRWNQSAPFNLACPGAYYNGGGPYYVATGCVATAMAQILNYHKWPVRGTGSHSYTWNTVDANNKSTTQTLSLDYDSQRDIMWDYMLDEYEKSYDAENDNNVAVALLMAYCGYAADMQYGADASGTSDQCARRGLAENLGYNPNCSYKYREHYDALEWEEMCYKELTDNGPLYYSGSGTAGGHAFVLDGYSYNGFFHFNWGWGGTSDGYFQLCALAPAVQGIGGNEDGFNIGQGAMFDLFPNKTGITATTKYEIYTESNVLVSASTSGFFTKTTTLSFTGSFWNNSDKLFSGKIYLGFKLKNQATSAETYISGGNVSNFEPGTGYSSKSISGSLPSNLDAGKYDVTLVFSVGNTSDWQPVKVSKYKTDHTVLTVTGTGYNRTASVTYPTDIHLPEVYDVNLISGIHSGYTTYYSYTIRNLNENCGWDGYIVPMLLSSQPTQFNPVTTSTIKANGSPVDVYLVDGEEKTVNYDTIGWYNISSGASTTISGSYWFAFCAPYNGSYYAVSVPQYVTVTSVSTSDNITFTVGEPEFSAVYGVGMQHIYAKVPVHTNSGFGGAVIGLVIYEDVNTLSDGQTHVRSTTSAIDVWTKLTGAEAGHDQVLEYACEVPGFSPTKKYYYSVLSMLAAENADIVTEIPTTPIVFADGAVTGVETVSADQTEEATSRLYNLAGVEVKSGRPAPGHYIEVVTFSDGSTQTRHKLVK